MSLLEKPSIYNAPAIYKQGGSGGGAFPVDYFGAVDIGGKTYHTQKIGNLLWTCENLDYLYPEANFVQAYRPADASRVPAVTYYGGFTEPIPHCGMLYNYYAFKELEQYLPNEWRLPTKEDFDNLCIYFGGVYDYIDSSSYRYFGPALLLKTAYDWTNYNGLDWFKLSFYPSGRKFGATSPTPPSNGLYEHFNSWTASEIDSTNAWRTDLVNTNFNLNFFKTEKKYAMSVRLVKDLL